ncbi:hypothetical protein GCM10027062_39480 [Nocardioides hungaricus]
MPTPHISVSAQSDVAHALEWSFENFGAGAEARYAALIAAAIAHAAQDPNAAGFKKRTELPGDVLSWHLSQSVMHSVGGRVRKPRHLLVCRWVDGQLQVARLLHEAQDPALNFDPTTDWE